MKLLHGIKVDGTKPAHLVFKPTGDLRQLYQNAFWMEWQSRTTTLIQHSLLTNRDIIEACIGAATHNLALNAPTPWPGPKETLAAISKDTTYASQVLRESGKYFNPLRVILGLTFSFSRLALDIHTVFWLAARCKVLDTSFQADTILPCARNLADRLMMTIHPQLNAISGVAIKAEDAFWDKRTEDITSIFSRALRLKGQIECAPEYHELKFAKSGRKFLPKKMKEIYQGDGPQEVAWCVLPAIFKRTNTQSEWLTVCPANVSTRPREGEEH